jgi:hypothetical protein
MLVSTYKQELLAFVSTFRLGSGRNPHEDDMRTLNVLLENLAIENPTPLLSDAFQKVAGFWKCVFTTSRFVLDLDKLPGVRLSGVYQCVAADPQLCSGHYYNVAELSRGAKVRVVCGEFAAIRPSQVDPVRMDVDYEWFYFAMRIISAYEGPRKIAVDLENDCLCRRMRFPFHRCGWQSILYLDDELRVVRGNEGGIFVLVRQ